MGTMDTARDLGTGITANDDNLYWGQPKDRHAELINGTLYDMTPPSRIHQRLVTELSRKLGNFIEEHNGLCEVYVAPFAVRLNLEHTDWVEPDVIVVCDPAKLSDRGCEGAPDLVVEIVSPSSRAHDYMRKAPRYMRAGVRELWIVDPDTRQTVVYRASNDDPEGFLTSYSFDEPIPVGIWNSECSIMLGDTLG